MKTEISTIISELRANENLDPINKEIYNDNSVSGNNEFLFFVKPEITVNDPNIKLEAILDLILSKINSFNLDIKNIRVVNAKYLAKHGIIAKHYGVINKLSRNIKQAITEEGKENFKKIYDEAFDTAKIYGSLEFLEMFPEFSPTGLSFLWQNATTEKLAGGTYSQKLELDGKRVYLVNGFHPRQLDHFIAPGKAIITMTLVSNTSWDVARNDFIGKTNPQDAALGSIRRELLENKDEYGMQSVSSSWNGVHLSAGPIEGLVELLRYNSNYEKSDIRSALDYSFGQKIAQTFDEQKAENLLKNPDVSYEGKHISIFDLTEELNSNDCINLLEKVSMLA